MISRGWIGGGYSIKSDRQHNRASRAHRRASVVMRCDCGELIVDGVLCSPCRVNPLLSLIAERVPESSDELFRAA